LVMVGEGELRTEIENFINDNKLANVHLPGFINQSEIVKYYAVADVFVLCSGEGETWGLSVNEAMNFNLPVVVSEMAGCAHDLVQFGVNGFVFKCGNVRVLANQINQALVFAPSSFKSVLYSYLNIKEALLQVDQNR